MMCCERTIQSDLRVHRVAQTLTFFTGRHVVVLCIFFPFLLNVHCIYSFYWFNFVNLSQAISRIQCIIMLTFYFTYSDFARRYCASNVSLSIFSLCSMQNRTFFFFDVRREQAERRWRRCGEGDRVKWGLKRGKSRIWNFSCYDCIENDSFHRFRFIHPRTVLTAIVQRNVLEIELKTLYWWEIVKEY